MTLTLMQVFFSPMVEKVKKVCENANKTKKIYSAFNIDLIKKFC